MTSGFHTRRAVRRLGIFVLAVTLAALWMAAPSGAVGGTLVDDDFDGPLSVTWTVQRGNAGTVDGWLVTQGSTPGTRDSMVLAGEGSDWSGYRFRTRFIAEGGGDTWYNAFVAFRVADMYGWGFGTYYQLSVVTPLWPGEPTGAVSLHKRIDAPPSSILLQRTVPVAGVLDAFDNTVDVLAEAGHFRVWVNDVLVIDVIDPDPILTGGVGLGAIWESTTRFDYALVETVLPGRCRGVAATISGTEHPDTLVGTDGADVIDARGGADVVSGRKGNDVICGGEGADVLRGSDGADTVQGDGGDDTIFGGRGNDLLFGGDGADTLSGAGGRDTLRGQAGSDLLRGGDAADLLIGGTGDDRLFGNGGADQLRGSSGSDTGNGGPGTDTCTGLETATSCP